jgi:Holliday junction resolvase RusA-like endonuclease
MMELSLPFPPSANHYYRHVGYRTLISREGRAYREMVCSILGRMGVRPLDGGLVVRIELYPPDKRRRDADNSLKCLLDSLQHGGAYKDDGQIMRLSVEKREPVPLGKVVVRIGKA